MPGAAEAAARSARERRTLAATPRPGPPNPQFEHVKPVVDTCVGAPACKVAATPPEFRLSAGSGFNVRKLEELVAQGRVHARFRRPEPFRRLTCALLARVLTEDSGGVHAQVLDLRTPDEFAACHVMQARCYPAALLRRAHTPFDAEFVAFANREHDLARILILYDEDERLAVPAAQLCCEKGVDNVFVLTGGLLAFGGRFPDLLVGVPHPSLAAKCAAAAGLPIARSRASVASLARSRRDSLGGGEARSARLSAPELTRWRG